MKNQRWRSLVYAVAGLVVVWLLVLAGFGFAKKTKMTAEKLGQFVASVDFAKLSGAERSRALREFADKINALPPEDRSDWNTSGDWKNWFGEMTEGERAEFIEATLPTGIKQVMESFAQMPEEKRKKTIDDAIRRLRENRKADPKNEIINHGTNGPPRLSPDLEAKVRAIGLQTFFTESSAATKVELAPLLEEVQKQLTRKNFR